MSAEEARRRRGAAAAVLGCGVVLAVLAALATQGSPGAGRDALLDYHPRRWLAAQAEAGVSAAPHAGRDARLEFHPGRWLAAQAEAGVSAAVLAASGAVDDARGEPLRLWSRGNSRYAGEDGDYVDDAGIGVRVSSLRPAGAARTQMLLLDQSEWEKPLDPYVPPSDLYLYWGTSSARGTLASGFQGGRGRSASGERVRQVLRFGTFTGNGYMDDTSGHGKFLGSWDGSEFERLSIRCCVTLLVPPMERHLPIASEEDELSRKIRAFVSNGNMLIMTGGDFSSLVFLNRFFHYDIRKTVYDRGPFEKMPAKALPANAAAAFKDLPETLAQSGLSVTSVTKESLPPDTRLIYATPVSSPVFEITYCQATMPREQCEVVKPQGYACVVDVLPRDCQAHKDAGRACSCGSIVYVGYDFVDHHSHQMGTSVWDKVLRAAVAMPKIGDEGLGEFTKYM